jgi:tetratricopeptide (TPR) repeat protein
MLRVTVFCGALLLAVGSASAGLYEDCDQGKDPDLSIRSCSTLIKKNPRDGDAYASRGIAYYTKGEYDRAIADYTRSIEINPKDAITYSNRGRAYNDKGEYDRAIADYTRSIEINPKDAIVYNNRGDAYRGKGDNDRAIADFNRAIEINPKDWDAYNNRGIAYDAKHETDRAIADYTRSIEINPKGTNVYNNRGRSYHDKGEYDRAIADYNKAIEINPKNADNYNYRGRSYYTKYEYDRVIADFTKAIEIDSKHADYYEYRGSAHYKKHEYDLAIADYTKAIEINPKEAMWNIVERGRANEAKGERDKAIEDYNRALTLSAHSEEDKEKQSEASKLLAALKGAVSITASVSTPAPPISGYVAPGRRVALVIGNSNYQAVGRLPNPVNDSRAIAASLRRLNFAEVIERYDLGQAAMGVAIKEFGDRTANAEWAVVYYAGHGIEMNGMAYLIPVDAKLEKDTHVSDETIALNRVLEKVEPAQKLRLVILDACRNNPFVARMIRTGGVSRSIGRGLAPIEPEAGVLVAYSAKHGTTAEDGTGTNSPFAQALLAYLEEPGLEINFLFRKVRDRVLANTGRRQEPYLYGSLPSESLFFKVVR